MNEPTLMNRAQHCYKRLRLPAMDETVKRLLADPESMKLSQLEWLVTGLEAECDRRDTNALKEKMKRAHLKYSNAEASQLIYSAERNLDQAMVTTLTTCEWIRNHQNCLITGKVGTGKTYLAECLAVAACRMGINARSTRVPLLLQEVSNSHGVSGEYRAELRALKRVELLVLDDLGLGPLDAVSRGDLLEIIEARHEVASTIVTSVLPVSAWSSWIGDPTYADAVLDRLTANAVRIELKGESLRSRTGSCNRGEKTA